MAVYRRLLSATSILVAHARGHGRLDIHAVQGLVALGRSDTHEVPAAPARAAPWPRGAAKGHRTLPTRWAGERRGLTLSAVRTCALVAHSCEDYLPSFAPGTARASQSCRRLSAIGDLVGLSVGKGSSAGDHPPHKFPNPLMGAQEGLFRPAVFTL